MFTKSLFLAVIWCSVDSTLLKEDVTHRKYCDGSLAHAEKFWPIYKWHFHFCKILTVTLLNTDRHRTDVREFADVIIRHLLYYGNKNLSVEVRERYLLRYTYGTNRPQYDANEYLRNSTSRFTRDQLIKLKRLSSYSFDGHVVIAWDEEVLQKFLDKNYRLVIPKARAPYVFLFLVSSGDACPDDARGRLTSVLVRLWVQFGVLNAIAQTPCSCDGDTIYSYSPFHRVDKTTWGAVRNHTLDEVLDDPGLITNCLHDLNGAPLTVSMFVRNPTAVIERPKLLRRDPLYTKLKRFNIFAGLDGWILAVMSERLNFQVRVFNSTGFGATLKNGTITESLKDVVDGRAVLSSNGRFIIDYGTDGVEFTTPYSQDQICVIAPKAGRVPQWQIVFKLFSPTSWAVFLTCVLTSSFFWYLIRPLKQGRRGARPRSKMKTWYEMLSFFLGIPVKITPSPSQCIFLITCIIFNVITVGIIQGYFFKSFATVTYFPDINTLEDLDNSGLPIATNLGTLDSNQSELFSRLRAKTKPSFDNIWWVITHEKKLATLDRKRDMVWLIQIEYTRSDGVPLVHIVSECLASYYIAFIVPKGSALLKSFDVLMMRFFESGLTLKWYNDFVYAMVLEKMSVPSGNEQSQRPFGLKDVQGAFYVLAIGYLTALLTFFWEIAPRRTGEVTEVPASHLAQTLKTTSKETPYVATTAEKQL